MGFLDRLFGSDERTEQYPPPAAAPAAPRDTDAIAVERYRYLLRTAPPETIEQVHRGAFARLTDQQRAIIYEELSRGAQTGERPLSSEPATLARAATRAEFRRPGTMERAFGATGGAGTATGTDAGQQYAGGAHYAGGQAAPQQYAQRSGPSFGSMVGSTLLGTVAGYVVGSALVSAFLPWDAGIDGSADASGDQQDAGADAGAGDASSADAGGADVQSADWGGGDFGGGDFGSDFGGGDFGGFDI